MKARSVVCVKTKATESLFCHFHTQSFATTQHICVRHNVNVQRNKPANNVLCLPYHHIAADRREQFQI